LYIVEERARNRPSLVSDVGVRLPAHLTASGRAILAQLPAAQLRSLYGKRADFTSRTAVTGPATPGELRALLTRVRQDGIAAESLLRRRRPPSRASARQRPGEPRPAARGPPAQPLRQARGLHLTHRGDRARHPG